MEDTNCTENLSICSTVSESEIKTEFEISIFSSDLIIEYICQHLDLNPTCRIVSNTPTNENVKNWVRLVDITLNCLKCEMKQYRSGDTKGYLHDRKSAIKLICKWLNDVKLLRNTYNEHICEKLFDSRMKAEVVSLFHHLDILANSMEAIFMKDVTKDMRKKEMFFVVDDVSSCSTSHYQDSQ